MVYMVKEHFVYTELSKNKILVSIPPFFFFLTLEMWLLGHFDGVQGSCCIPPRRGPGGCLAVLELARGAFKKPCAGVTSGERNQET